MRPFEAADHRAVYFYFHFNPTATTAIYTLSLHDALPIFHLIGRANAGDSEDRVRTRVHECDERIHHPVEEVQDRKSTRLNSSHVAISYAVFCLKKKKNKGEQQHVHDYD